MATITIDGRGLEFEEKLTILEAAKKLQIKIPTLCYNEHLAPYGGCRICLVEVASPQAPDRSRLLPACSTPVENGQIVVTGSERVEKARRFIVELFLSRCPDVPELWELASELGAKRESPEGERRQGSDLDVVGDYLLNRAPRREQTKCILCSLCVRACAEVPGRFAISFSKRGMERKVKTPFDKVAESCIGCGSCAYVCPTNAITIEEVS
jgi:bidirectional [NiFe] hydrogenase diaphorase subunit